MDCFAASYGAGGLTEHDHDCLDGILLLVCMVKLLVSLRKSCLNE